MKIYTLLILSLFIISCNKTAKIDGISKGHFKQKEVSLKSNKKNTLCKDDSIKIKVSEYNGIEFFTENIMRGDGVIQLTPTREIKILNLDKTIYGSIIPQSINQVPSLEIYLPKTTIAREIIPDSEFQIFDFDAELPSKENAFIKIYINKEQKLISKNNLKYKFLTWKEYVESAFIQLTPNIKNITKEELQLWYKSDKINGDSMLIKSIVKTECEYVEDYKDISKWIKWKNNNCKLIKFSFCY
ncbi:hypothetical protein FE904_16330 [Chryseobacterium indologenes]|uniref:hypothetical protein n=1 Tax=Chryseobacterium indologenes TaxID=253 RepID=UPI0011086E23|nr:hypothetical protein [Chryseobacterium indologenes]TLX24419.1 hypothetical protein FE904_16330 [Chryseobacterium indologenes]